MRTPLADSLRRAALCLAAAMLLVVGGTLLVGTNAAFDRRDAFAARVERGEIALSPQRVAAEWRSEIAAQQYTARRDRVLAILLIGTGVAAAVTLVRAGATHRGPRPAQASAARTPTAA